MGLQKSCISYYFVKYWDVIQSSKMQGMHLVISPLLLEMVSNLHKKLSKFTEDLNECEGIC